MIVIHGDFRELQLIKKLGKSVYAAQIPPSRAQLTHISNGKTSSFSMLVRGISFYPCGLLWCKMT